MTSSRAIEAAVRGRRPAEITALFSTLSGPDRTAYRVCADRALEAACRVEVPEHVETLRRLLCCAAWIEGHATHLYAVQIPDLLGHPSTTDLIDREPRAVNRGIALRRVGLELATAVGEDALRIGGPRRPPERVNLSELRTRLDDAVDPAVRTVRWISGFGVAESVLDIPLLALDDPMPGASARGRARYPVDGGVGVLVSNGLGFPLGDFESFVSRTRSGPTRTGRAALRGSKATLTGPLARNALCAGLMRPAARGAADRAGLTATERNPYRSALIRAVELVHALEEAAALIDGYEAPSPARPVPVAGPGRGAAAVESPSGLVYLRFDLLQDGTIGSARLIGPDELNRNALELDLRRTERTAVRRDPAITPSRLAELRAELAHNYDPGDAGPTRTKTNGPDHAAHAARPYR